MTNLNKLYTLYDVHSYNTKNGISKNIIVFNAIIEIAKEYKDTSNQLKRNLQRN